MRLCSFIVTGSLAALATFASEQATAPTPIIEDLSLVVQMQRDGRYTEAEKLANDVIRRLDGVPNSEVALGVALNNLASINQIEGRYAEAETRYWKAVRIMEPLLTETADTALAYTKFNLARLYLERGRIGDVERLHLDTVLDSLRDPEARTRGEGTLGGLAAQQKNFAKAERIYLHALGFWTDPSRAGRNQLEIAALYNNLSLIALWQGRMDVANARISRSLDIWRHLDSNDPLITRVMATSGVICSHLKRYDDAVVWLGRAAETGRRRLGETHSVTVLVELAYADALKKMGRKAEAKQVAQAASIARKSMPSNAYQNGMVDFRELMTFSVAGRR